jgi:hypothetical protein
MRAEGVERCTFLDAEEFIGNGQAGGNGPEAAESYATFRGCCAEHCAIGLKWAVFGSQAIWSGQMV